MTTIILLIGAAFLATLLAAVGHIKTTNKNHK